MFTLWPQFLTRKSYFMKNTRFDIQTWTPVTPCTVGTTFNISLWLVLNYSWKIDLLQLCIKFTNLVYYSVSPIVSSQLLSQNGQILIETHLPHLIVPKYSDKVTPINHRVAWSKSCSIFKGYFVYKIYSFDCIHVLKATMVAFTFNRTICFIILGAKGILIN